MGYSSLSPSQRLILHVSNAKRKNKDGYLFRHYRANKIRRLIREGKNFKLVPFLYCPNLEEVKKQEVYFIDWFSKNFKLCNSTKGGEGFTGGVHTLEARQKMSKAKSKPRGTYTKEHRENISKSLKGNQNRLGNKQSRGTKQKISKALKGNVNSKGRILSEENKQKMKQAYIQKYGDYGFASESVRQKAMNKIKRKIIQKDKDKNFIKEWESATDAGRILGINSRNIASVCRGKRKSAGGFLWEYKEKLDSYIVEEL